VADMIGRRFMAILTGAIRRFYILVSACRSLGEIVPLVRCGKNCSLLTVVFTIFDSRSDNTCKIFLNKALHKLSQTFANTYCALTLMGKTIVLMLIISISCAISYAQEEVVSEVPEIAAAPVLADTEAWIEDELPVGAKPLGEWIWADDIKFSGTSSHTDGINNELHAHSFEMAEPIVLNKDSVIEQLIYLDSDNPPKGIMLKLISADGDNIDLYWEAEEEVFVDTTEYMDAWYMGFLPKLGSWQKLRINIKELEIAPYKIIGISFMTYDGRSYWDSTVVIKN